MEQIKNITDIQRNAVAAQWAFDAALKSFEANAVIENEAATEQCIQHCHNTLDTLLACKQALFKEFLVEDFKVS